MYCDFVAAGACLEDKVDEVAIADGEAMFAIAAFAQDETFHAPAAIENYLRDFSIKHSPVSTVPVDVSQ